MDKKFLVLKRSLDSIWNPGQWELPGGKIDNGETFDEALVREVLEETGLTVRLTGVKGTTEDETEEFRVIHLVMIGECENCRVILSHEHEGFKWVTEDEAVALPLCSYVNEILR